MAEVEVGAAGKLDCGPPAAAAAAATVVVPLLTEVPLPLLELRPLLALPLLREEDAPGVWANKTPGEGRMRKQRSAL